MALLSVKNVVLKGVASCVPQEIEENMTLPLFEVDEANKFCATTGIFNRRIVESKMTTSDLCFHAAEKLILDLGWEKDSIECLIFVSQTPDYILPATSCILQDRLGLSSQTYAIDLSMGCSGWVYGLATITQIMSASCLKRGLLLAGDTISKICSKEDKSTYPLFGDAGTATAFEYVQDANDFKIHVATDGGGCNAIVIPDGGYRSPFTYQSLYKKEIEKGITRNQIELVLNGMDVFSFGISKAPQSVNQLLEYANIDNETIDYYLFHQANLFMNEKIRKKLNLPKEKVPYSLKNFGNTSSATIPLTMVTELKSELRNEKLSHIACGFGVGLSWGSVCFETNKIVCSDLIEI